MVNPFKALWKRYLKRKLLIEEKKLVQLTGRSLTLDQLKRVIELIPPYNHYDIFTSYYRLHDTVTRQETRIAKIKEKLNDV